MNRAAVLILPLLAASVAGMALSGGPTLADEKKPVAKDRKPKFTISKETTYVTGPLDKHGYIDYEAALNDRLGRGITPDSNACVLLWKALGPHPERATMPPEFFRRLSVPQPPEDGEYFVELSTYVKDQLKIAAEDRREEIFKDLAWATQRAWTAKQYPHLAGWLKANEKPLAVVIKATRRSNYYSPIVSKKSEKGTSSLMEALLPGVQKCRELANALTARAMLQAGERRHDDAWQDLLACHRLGRQVARGAGLIDALVGLAIDQIAARAGLTFAGDANLDPKRLRNCLRDLQALPEMPVLADKIELGERFMILEAVMLVDRHGIPYLEALSAGSPARGLAAQTDRLLKDVNWDPALRKANRWYDRLTTAMRIKDWITREEHLSQFDNELKTLKQNLTESDYLAKLLVGGETAKGEVIGEIMICLFIPAVRKVGQAADRAEQGQRNLHLAFALAAYQREQGKYPEKLDALTPAYLPQVPQDLFSGGPLLYRPSAKGYLLYSVSVNGKDEQGRGHDDDPPGDDLSVRMPLPSLRRH